MKLKTLTAVSVILALLYLWSADPFHGKHTPSEHVSRDSSQRHYHIDDKNTLKHNANVKTASKPVSVPFENTRQATLKSNGGITSGAVELESPPFDLPDEPIELDGAFIELSSPPQNLDTPSMGRVEMADVKGVFMELTEPPPDLEPAMEMRIEMTNAAGVFNELTEPPEQIHVPTTTLPGK